MPRTSRMIIPNENAVYHVMSRSACNGQQKSDKELSYF